MTAVISEIFFDLVEIAPHRFYYTGNRLPAIAGFNRSLLRQFAGMMRVIRILFHRRSELLHAGGSLFDCRRLFFGAR